MLSFQIETAWCNWLKLVDPVAFPLLPEATVPASHLFYDQDGEITQGMPWDVEVGIYWFLCSIILDVTAVSIEADVERILCFSHILLLASFAFDKECRRWKNGIVHAGSQLKKMNSTGSWFSQIMNNCGREGITLHKSTRRKVALKNLVLRYSWQTDNNVEHCTHGRPFLYSNWV